MDVIEQEKLVENAADIGTYLLEELKNSEKSKKFADADL